MTVPSCKMALINMCKIKKQTEGLWCSRMEQQAFLFYTAETRGIENLRFKVLVSTWSKKITVKCNLLKTINLWYYFAFFYTS